MEIYVLDGLNGIIGMIENYQSCIWTVQSMDLGNFEIITQATPANIDLLRANRYLVRSEDIDGSKYSNVMVIEATKIEYESDIGWKLAISGRGLKSLIGRRVIWDRTTTTTNQTVESFIRQVVTQECISPLQTGREIDSLQWVSSHGLTESAEMQVFGENVAEWITELCVLYGYSWDVWIDDDQGEPYYWIDLYKGADRSKSQAVNPPVVFSEEYDNLLAVDYTVDRTRFRNSGLAYGEFEDGGEITVCMEAFNSATATPGLGLYEIYVDGSEISSEDAVTLGYFQLMLKNYGKQQLWEYTIEKTFEGQIEPQGTYILGTDYEIGDKVTLETSLGISADVIITEIIDSVSEEGRTVILNLQEWEVNN